MQDSKLIIGISSRALFDLDESHEIYKKHGLKSYEEYQIDNEDKTLKPGQAFSLVNKIFCLLYTSPSPRDFVRSRMPSSA